LDKYILEAPKALEVRATCVVILLSRSGRWPILNTWN